jgi:hypothetical protein
MYLLPFEGGNGRYGSLSAQRGSPFDRVRRLCRVRVGLTAALSVLAGTLTIGSLDAPAWPQPLGANTRPPAGADDALVRAQPVCVMSTLDSAGELGSSLVVRHRREGDRLWVSYFAYWSSERPWGDKPFFASLAIDAFYSHFLFFLPGLRHALYGPGDVEGVTVVYREVEGRLEVIEGYGDDEYHRAVHLGPEDLTGGDQHTLLLTSWWSHQLGGRGAPRAAREPSTSRRCFEGPSLVPLTTEIAESFRLGNADRPLRARWAWL